MATRESDGRRGPSIEPPPIVDLHPEPADNGGPFTSGPDPSRSRREAAVEPTVRPPRQTQPHHPGRRGFIVGFASAAALFGVGALVTSAEPEPPLGDDEPLLLPTHLDGYRRMRTPLGRSGVSALGLVYTHGVPEQGPAPRVVGADPLFGTYRRIAVAEDQAVHGQPARCVLSHDGTWMAVGCSAGADGVPLVRLGGATRTVPISDAAERHVVPATFSPDGARLYVIAVNPGADVPAANSATRVNPWSWLWPGRLWEVDVATATAIPLEMADARDVAVSPDGSHLAVSRHNLRLDLVNARTGETRFSVEGGGTRRFANGWAPAGGPILTAVMIPGEGQRVRVTERSRGRRAHREFDIPETVESGLGWLDPATYVLCERLDADAKDDAQTGPRVTSRLLTLDVNDGVKHEIARWEAEPDGAVVTQAEAAAGLMLRWRVAPTDLRS